MDKEHFLSLELDYDKKTIGNVKFNTFNELPSDTTLLEDINYFIDYNGKCKPDIVYFLKNVDNKYYIELSNTDTNLDELSKYITLKLLYI